MKEQVERIRAAVARDGASVVACKDLRVLCLDETTQMRQFQRVSDIAQQEGWSFAFLPDGSVRFAQLSAQADQAALG